MLMDLPVPAQRRLIVGISGASGVVYGVRVLQLLRNAGIETHLVMSKTAELTFAYETTMKIAEVKAAAHTTHRIDDMAASIASGGFRTAGMIVAPCSIRSMSEIATGVTTTLLTRAADVTLKERRRLVLMVRETPLHGGHLRSMAALSDMGAIIAPPVPAFYAKPKSIEEMVDHTVGRMLDLFEIDVGTVRRWGGGRDLRARPLKGGSGVSRMLARQRLPVGEMLELERMDRFNLGSHSRTISTGSREAQRWFDLGLNWCFAFNKSEGVKCFRKALDFDPECVMAHWGIAYGCGPFYNMTWRDHSEEEANTATGMAYEHIQIARALTHRATELENRLVETLARRVQRPHSVQPEEFDRWDDDYAAELRRVYYQYRNDHDVAALLVEALITRTPRRLWNVKTGLPAKNSDVIEALEVCERAIDLADG